ncbi:MAG: response regulator [Lachnospiraceae bacterium]|nr:response regulator [Lachnospiraceae bacterium]
MRFNIDFEILGALVTLAIAYNFKRNYVSRTRSENTFIRMVYFILGSQILDMVSAYTICLEKPELNILNHILTSGYFLCAFATSVAFERYVVTYIAEVSKNRVYDILRKTVIIAYTVFSLLNPITGLAFYFDDNGIYYHGSLYVLGYIAPAIFMIASLFFVVQYRRCFAKKQWVSSVFFIFVVFIAMTLQIAVLKDLYLTFGIIPVALLMVMFSLETPDYKKLMKTLDELEKAKQEALSANKVKSDFLANMSHEIRTPINSILGFNEMILRETEDDETFAYASNIKTSGQNLLSIVNDILDLSKIEAGKMEIVSVEYDIANAITSLIKMIMPRAEEKGLSLKYQIDSNIPKKLFGDEVRVFQVLTNLMTNAVKYTEKGEVKLDIYVKRVHGDKVDLYFAVKDTGIGIKPENIEKLFSEFSRIEESAHKIEGTGLGIPITMKCLNLMGSKLEVESIFGKGSLFYFVLEQKIVDKEPIGEFKTVQLDEYTDVEVFREDFVAPDAHVLVVDDVEMNLKVFKGLLKYSRMQIDTAGSGAMAIELLKKNSYDIVFMDHQMPEMDGIETLGKIKADEVLGNIKVPFIALTANAISGARDMYMKKGFSDYLTKPVDGRKLSEMLRKWLPSDIIRLEKTEKKKHDKEEIKEPDNSEVTESGKTSDISGLTEIGLDVKRALEYCMQDESFYAEIIHDFVSSTENNRAEMSGYLEKKDFKNFGIKAHALKGLARTIGADELSEKAKALEMAAKAGDGAFIEENGQNLLEAYGELSEKLDKWCAIYDKR